MSSVLGSTHRPGGGFTLTLAGGSPAHGSPTMQGSAVADVGLALGADRIGGSLGGASDGGGSGQDRFHFGSEGDSGGGSAGDFEGGGSDQRADGSGASSPEASSEGAPPDFFS